MRSRLRAVLHSNWCTDLHASADLFFRESGSALRHISYIFAVAVGDRAGALLHNEGRASAYSVIVPVPMVVVVVVVVVVLWAKITGVANAHANPSKVALIFIINLGWAVSICTWYAGGVPLSSCLLRLP